MFSWDSSSSDEDEDYFLDTMLRAQIQPEVQVAGSKKRRRAPPRRGVNYKQWETSSWFIFLATGDFADENSKDSQSFRLRFRVPYSLFQKLLTLTELWFPPSVSAAHAPSAPNSLKLLGVLKILGRGCTFDDCHELSNVGNETHRRFFHGWIKRFRLELGDVYIKVPTTQSEIDQVTSLFEVAGFPGCIGSMDCVHIRWDKCPQGWRHGYRGRSGHPTIVFEAVCSHSKRILHVSGFHPGARNDMAIVKFDTFAQGVHEGRIYKVPRLICYQFLHFIALYISCLRVRVRAIYPVLRCLYFDRIANLKCGRASTSFKHFVGSGCLPITGTSAGAVRFLR
jgi:hypothetical protein